MSSPRALIAVLLAIGCSLPAIASAFECHEQPDWFADQKAAFSSAVQSCGRWQANRHEPMSARLCVAEAAVERDRSIADLLREERWSPKLVEDSANRAAASSHALARLRCRGLDDEVACRVEARRVHQDQRADNRERRRFARAEERARDERITAERSASLAGSDR